MNKTQTAVQLVGPDQLTLNIEKPVHQPGPMQLLCQVEAVGLCFSDLKLLKQFSGHVRKGDVLRGVAQDVLDALPSYAPREEATVPGHEAVVRIVAVGEGVARHAVGERVLVQADWRELRTEQSNAAFGYNVEGALQEYVLLDERIVIEPSTQQRYLLPAGEERSASAIALVEPWACVEDSYVTEERNHLAEGGTLLVVADPGRTLDGLADCIAAHAPSRIVTMGCTVAGGESIDSLDALAAMSVDDVLYFGHCCETIEQFCPALGNNGIANIVLGGESLAREVQLDVGRVHYGCVRWCGTAGMHAAEGYASIPHTGEIRDDDCVCVIGAGGPMGQMHVIRNLCTGHHDVTVVATDFDANRLKGLTRIAQPLADSNHVAYRAVNTKESSPTEIFSYVALMAPVATLVASAIAEMAPKGILNIFAGIPAGTLQAIDLDRYIRQQLWMFGTSGSTIGDMQRVLEKVESGQLDTNLSVDAICGMAGAIEGIRAVEHRTLAGKILVYPALTEMGLIPLEELHKELPEVAAKLKNGRWTEEAERTLLGR